jgi:hypothetical protein
MKSRSPGYYVTGPLTLASPVQAKEPVAALRRSTELTRPPIIMAQVAGSGTGRATGAATHQPMT